MMEDMYVVDADSHWSEPADLFTSRAPAQYRDRVPRVEVIDGGCGFGGHAGQVFDSFFTTKSGGMGLGLSISRSIAERHGGTLTATRNAGHTRFTLSLPVERNA